MQSDWYWNDEKIPNFYLRTSFTATAAITNWWSLVIEAEAFMAVSFGQSLCFEKLSKLIDSIDINDYYMHLIYSYFK